MTYSPHAYKILNATTEYFDTMNRAETIQQKIADLKQMRNAEKITEKGFKEMAAPFKAEYDKIQREASNKTVTRIAEIRQAYFQRVDAWAEPTPGKMHPDLKMLTGTLALTADQLEKLGEKHSKNPVMTGAIRQYAADRKLDVYFSAPTPEAKKAAFDSLCASAANVAKNGGGIQQAVYTDRSSFEKYALPAALQDCGE